MAIERARAKLSCINCHDPHSESSASLMKTVQNGKLDLGTLTRDIEQEELAANIAAVGSKAKEEANARVEQLKKEEARLRGDLKGAETAYQRVTEPYICYNCHKTQQVQGRMTSHHPILENKMKCSDCHNPHGGPLDMLTAESVNETCFQCHAEKEGPFTFDHPPVSENCTICHNPHGSVQNNLLVQSQPFLCLKCHAGPHSRPVSLPGVPAPGVPALGSPSTIPQYYTQCTDCHSQVHGSDEHGALHY